MATRYVSDRSGVRDQKARRAVASSSPVNESTAKDPQSLAATINRALDRVQALESAVPRDSIDFDVTCPSSGTVTLEHRFGGPVRWWVTSWKRKGTPGMWSLTEVSEPSTVNTLVLTSAVPGRAVIHVERAQAGLIADDTTRSAITSGGPFQDIVFGAEALTSTSTYTRLGARALNMASFAGATAKFVVTLENSLPSSSWYAQARLFDITNNVEVTGTPLDNSAASPRDVAAEYSSAALTIGSSSGNLRNDGSTMYAVQFRTQGTITDSNSQRAIIGNARLVITF